MERDLRKLTGFHKSIQDEALFGGFAVRRRAFGGHKTSFKLVQGFIRATFRGFDTFALWEAGKFQRPTGKGQTRFGERPSKLALPAIESTLGTCPSLQESFSAGSDSHET